MWMTHSFFQGAHRLLCPLIVLSYGFGMFLPFDAPFEPDRGEWVLLKVFEEWKGAGLFDVELGDTFVILIVEDGVRVIVTVT